MGFWINFQILYVLNLASMIENSVDPDEASHLCRHCVLDPDEKPYTMASHLGLHCVLNVR